MSEYKTQSDTMMNELATTIKEVWTELAQRLSDPLPSTVPGPVPQNGMQHMEPNPNSMLVMPYPNADESEYISMPQPMYNGPSPMGPPPNPNTNLGINGFDVQAIAVHPQTPSLTPGAPGVGGHLSEWLVTLEWYSDRPYRTRVRVVEETSEVLVSTWPAPLLLQAVECSMDFQKFQNWMNRVKKRIGNISEPSAVRFRPAFEEDQDSFDRLIGWLRQRGGDMCVSRRWSRHAVL
ncbi:hypothetical protein BJV78DRAFT_1223754 [Lactifluus subvellereus]|nr:hypothetical protein BJV78DRAFT_1223754 [Lactifluus subvellereus]